MRWLIMLWTCDTHDSYQIQTTQEFEDVVWITFNITLYRKPHCEDKALDQLPIFVQAL